MSIALNPAEIEERRRERARQLALYNIPLFRFVGSIFLTVGVALNNVVLAAGAPVRPWWEVAVALFVYAVVAWATVRFVMLRRDRDLTLFFLAGDIVLWTFAIYASGAEQSWLFFIPVLRVADQTQTTVRRCLGFAAWGVFCFTVMRFYVAFVDGRPIHAGVFLAKLTFIGVSGIYVAMAARPSEARREQMAASIRMSRDLIHQREEAVARAEEASAAKSDFLANMSHEMRTPLHGVIGMLQLARDGEASPQRIRQLEMAQRSAESLLGTIDDILDFSKIEARKIDLEPIYYALRQLMHETMKPLGITAAAKGLALAYIVGEAVPDSIWGDPLRLRQIIVNLVGNAIKFTHSGEIAVRVSATRDDDRHLQLHFEVRDTGVGIEPSQQDTIFQPFTQGETTTHVGGTGLGLAIVSRLVEAMGGSIDVESSPGKGSAFHFSITTETDAFAAPVRKPWEAMLAGKSMLVVDPHRSSRAFIAEMLRSRDVFATAIASADEAPRGARYALTITSDPSSATDRFIVISSPLASAHLEFPHVTRPVSERELFDVIGVALGATRPVAVTAAPQLITRGARLRVLVVEDHPVNQEFAAEALRRLGHDVAIASNGFEAVAKAERERFDAVLMDVQMPGIDGIEATKRLRATDNGRRARVIAMTAYTRKEDRDRCIEAGMDAVLTKPVNVTELAAALQSIEPDRMLETVGGNVRLLARVRQAFIQQTPPLVAAMQDAITSRDAAALHDAAHKLKGSVSNFETSATGLAQEIEDCARRGEIDRAATVMPHLEMALRELEKRLAAASGV